MRWITKLGVMFLFGTWILAACTAAAQIPVPTEGKPAATGQEFQPSQPAEREDLTSQATPEGAPSATPLATPVAAPSRRLQFIEFYSPM